MTKEIAFPYPFAGYSSLDFINCFASAYMCIEGFDGTEDCYCGGKRAVCDSCGDCRTSLGKKQEELFFLFGTVTGCNALRDCFNGPTEMDKLISDSEDSISFAMGFAGYEYQRVASAMGEAVVASVDAGRPVLARMKSADRGSFRVITGYLDGGATLLCPEPTGAQRKPEGPPAYDEIDSLYVITDKGEPTITLKDGFERIIRVMEFNRDQALWDGYIAKFSHYWGDLRNAAYEEIQRRFRRVCETMWHTFNCHNFAETFRRELWHRLPDPKMRELFQGVDAAYDLTHTRCWQVIALQDGRNWTKRLYNELEWGFCNCVVMCLEDLKRNDETVLALMKECARMLSE
ncbi:MAG TPA: hypothetical protein VGN26_16040 [Armatimonadota bacterium]|jgi:hypothetical protein